MELELPPVSTSTSTAGGGSRSGGMAVCPAPGGGFLLFYSRGVSIYCVLFHGVDSGPTCKSLWSAELSSQVELLRITRPSSTGTFKPLLFACHGSIISGYSLKGKMFFQFDTNLTESIIDIVIFDEHIHLITEHLYAHYMNGKELACFHSPAVISTLLVPSTLSTDTVFLLCHGGIVREVRGSAGGKEISCTSCLMSHVVAARSDGGDTFYYSQLDGSFGTFDIGSKCLSKSVTLPRMHSDISKILMVSDRILVQLSGDTELRAMDVSSGNVLMEYHSLSPIVDSFSCGPVLVLRSLAGKFMVVDPARGHARESAEFLRRQINEMARFCKELEESIASTGKAPVEGLKIPVSNIILDCKYARQECSLVLGIESLSTISSLTFTAASLEVMPSVNSLISCEKVGTVPLVVAENNVKQSYVVRGFGAKGLIPLFYPLGHSDKVVLTCVLDTAVPSFRQVDLALVPLYTYQPSEGTPLNDVHFFDIRGIPSESVLKEILHSILPSSASRSISGWKCSVTNNRFHITSKSPGEYRVEAECLVAIYCIKQTISTLTASWSRRPILSIIQVSGLAIDRTMGAIQHSIDEHVATVKYREICDALKTIQDGDMFSKFVDENLKPRDSMLSQFTPFMVAFYYEYLKSMHPLVKLRSPQPNWAMTKEIFQEDILRGKMALKEFFSWPVVSGSTVKS